MTPRTRIAFYAVLALVASCDTAEPPEEPVEELEHVAHFTELIIRDAPEQGEPVEQSDAALASEAASAEPAAAPADKSGEAEKRPALLALIGTTGGDEARLAPDVRGALASSGPSGLRGTSFGKSKGGGGATGLGGLGTRGSGSAGGGYGSSALAYRRAMPLEQPALHTEAYEGIEEADWKSALDDALSTFSVDVDTASYSNVRRFLDRGQRPPASAVRIEELINYFSYDYPQPEGEHPFSTTVEVADCPWDGDNLLVQVGVQGERMELAELPRMNLVFLLDVSGSMFSPDKLPLVQRSMDLLVDELGPADRVSIVTYASGSGVALQPTAGDDKAALRRGIYGLRSGGSTAGAQGIMTAYELARESFDADGINRVILATDGDFNVGVTDNGSLVDLIEQQRESGVFLTVLGYGTGNLKDHRMELLADKGYGQYAYIDSVAEAKRVLVDEAAGTLHTIAKDVKIQVEFNPAEVASYRLLGYENRALAARDFDDDKKDAGEIGAGHSVTALYEVVPAGSEERHSGTPALRYQQDKELSSAASSGELMTLKLRYKQPDGDTSRLISQQVFDEGQGLSDASDDFRFAAAVAAFGMQLRGSDHIAGYGIDKARALAASAVDGEGADKRAELLRLMDRVTSGRMMMTR